MGKGRCIGTSRISAQQSYSYADQVNVIFSHWMEQFVRLQDCFVLLQSGECRHDTDIELCRTYAFKSQFGRDLLRKDGYTSLYSAKFYSGYGWDELFDEDVGLKSRITLALGGLSKDKQNRIWNDIMDKAPTIDNLLNEFEQSIKTLFQKVWFVSFFFFFFLIAAHNGVIRLSIVDKVMFCFIFNVTEQRGSTKVDLKLLLLTSSLMNPSSDGKVGNTECTAYLHQDFTYRTSGR